MSHLETARKVLFDNREKFCGYDMTAVAMELVAALDRAGLLATDLHRRALAACEAAAESASPYGTGKYDVCSAIGRESLAMKQPKPRWNTCSFGTELGVLGWSVYDSSPRRQQVTIDYNLTEAQARAVADALNALEAKEATP